MALQYDLENDIRYKQGIEKQAVLGIKTLLDMNVPHQKIADSLQVPLEFVKKVADSLKNN